MPRVARTIAPGCPYHVMNRDNGRVTLFHKPADYDAFCRVLTEGLGRYAIDLFSFCLMPNHWHLLLCESEVGALSSFMSWVGVTHVRRHHEHHHTRGGGHLYQGRFSGLLGVPAIPGRSLVLGFQRFYTWAIVSSADGCHYNH